LCYCAVPAAPRTRTCEKVETIAGLEIVGVAGDVRRVVEASKIVDVGSDR
jgi:hypothetical protein